MALTFGIDADGVVRAGTGARGAALPDSVTADEVTPEWSEKVAEQVMFVVIGDRQAPITNDADLTSAGGADARSNQSRSGRLQRRDNLAEGTLRKAAPYNLSSTYILSP
jgi:hypothetical protein